MKYLGNDVFMTHWNKLVRIDSGGVGLLYEVWWKYFYYIFLLYKFLEKQNAKY